MFHNVNGVMETVKVIANEVKRSAEIGAKVVEKCVKTKKSKFCSFFFCCCKSILKVKIGIYLHSETI